MEISPNAFSRSAGVCHRSILHARTYWSALIHSRFGSTKLGQMSIFSRICNFFAILLNNIDKPFLFSQPLRSFFMRSQGSGRPHKRRLLAHNAFCCNLIQSFFAVYCKPPGSHKLGLQLIKFYNTRSLRLYKRPHLLFKYE